jgi:hypothetical protein
LCIAGGAKGQGGCGTGADRRLGRRRHPFPFRPCGHRPPPGAIFESPGAVLYLYPEALSIYGIAAATALVLAIGQRASQSTARFGLAGLGLGAGAAVLLCLLFWAGTLEYMFLNLVQAAGTSPDWWKYFQLYLFGSEQNYLAVLTDPESSHGQIATAWFSLRRGIARRQSWAIPRASNVTKVTASNLLLRQAALG